MTDAEKPPVTLQGNLSRLSDWHIEVLYRIAKRRLRPFFADPRAMQVLRAERDRRIHATLHVSEADEAWFQRARRVRKMPPLVLTKRMRRK